MLSQRSYTPEIMDLGPAHYTLAEYMDCLKKLSHIGRWLGGNSAGLQGIKKSAPASILDVGCGGGFFTILMAKKFPQSTVVGLEINPLAVAFARTILEEMDNPPGNVSFELQDSPDLKKPPKSYDVVTATLVCHHMNDPMLVDFLRKACTIARKRVVLNDLHRHPIAYVAFKTIAPLFFRNRLVINDGPLSVKRAFKRREWEHYLIAAGIDPEHFSIRWRWAFRWLVDIDCSRFKV